MTLGSTTAPHIAAEELLDSIALAAIKLRELNGGERSLAPSHLPDLRRIDGDLWELIETHEESVAADEAEEEAKGRIWGGELIINGMGPLPEDIALKLVDLVVDHVVDKENTHGADWLLVGVGDQGPEAEEHDRYIARFRSTQGHGADYFYFDGAWSCGAN